MNTSQFSEKRFAEIQEYRDDKFNLKKVQQLIGKYISHKKGKKLLDIGCSDGSFALLLKKRFCFDVYGTDIVAKAIAKAKLILNFIKEPMIHLSDITGNLGEQIVSAAKK